jgi:hypothetical protein
MSRLIVLIVIAAIAWLAYRYITRGAAGTRDAPLPAPAACPRCSRMLSLSDIACANCGRAGDMRRSVERNQRGVAETRFDCDHCHTSVATLPCPHCKTNVAGVFSARNG